MSTPVVNLSVHLEAAFRKEGRSWLAWCLPLDVMTQAETKKAALKSLKEAVELWFESCIQRGALDDALTEVGFHRVRTGERIPHGSNLIRVHRPRRAPSRASKGNFTEFEDFEVIIPAFIAVEQLEPSAAR